VKIVNSDVSICIWWCDSRSSKHTRRREATFACIDRSIYKSPHHITQRLRHKSNKRAFRPCACSCACACRFTQRRPRPPTLALSRDDADDVKASLPWAGPSFERQSLTHPSNTTHTCIHTHSSRRGRRGEGCFSRTSGGRRPVSCVCERVVEAKASSRPQQQQSPSLLA
jgi:hypothetical protein